MATTVKSNAVPDLQALTAFQTKEVPKELWMTPEDLQKANEYHTAKQHIQRIVEHDLSECDGLSDRIEAIVTDIHEWIVEGDFYPVKADRLALLPEDRSGLHEIVWQLCVGCAPHDEKPELYTSVVGQLAHSVSMIPNQRDRVCTVAELLTHLHRHQLIQIVKVPSKGKGAKFNRESLAIQSRMVLSQTTKEYVSRSQKLLPFVAPPKRVTSNQNSGYHTFKEAVTLNGRIKEHLALDTINTQNQTALTLDLEFLLNVPEVPNKTFDDPEKEQAWEQFYSESQEAYLKIYQQSQANIDSPGAIWFSYNYDLRGRMYASGYHITPQGAPYKKAMLEFNEVEFIEVPAMFRTDEPA